MGEHVRAFRGLIQKMLSVSVDSLQHAKRVQSDATPELQRAAKAVEDWYDEGLERTGPRPAIVAQNIGALDEEGLPLWLR